MGFPTRARVEALRKQYPPGTMIRLVFTDDPYTKLKPGDRANVISVDDAGQLVLQWENGSSLSLIPGVDRFEKIEEEEHE